MTDLVKDLTAWEALDKVKSLRKAWESCNGALYKNVAVEHMQDFLEACIAKWGQPFMDCVSRELHEERFPSAVWSGDKGYRNVEFPPLTLLAEVAEEQED